MKAQRIKNTPQIIKPTESARPNWSCTIFLAGSIEMGSADCKDWQTEVANSLDGLGVTLYNPRRDSWDSSWTQEQKSENFNYQVNWELNKLDECDIIFMHIEPNTKSPITLLEFGMFADSKKLILSCPDGFYRKGNLEVVCTRFNIPLYNDLETAIGGLRTLINKKTI
jgi:Nucleoside 2-deoxyribosyltransferase like